MAAFFALPLDISLAILGDWVSFRTLGRLDSACTSSFLRDDFLAVIRDPFKIDVNCVIDIDRPQNGGVIQWVNKRGVRLAAIELYLGSLEQWIKSDPRLLSTVATVTVQAAVWDGGEESIDLVKFCAFLCLLPSLTCFEIDGMEIADESAGYVGVLASMIHMKMKKIALDFSCKPTKHLSELISSFHGTLEWLSLGQRTMKRDGRLLEMISTMCTKLTHLDVTLSDDSSRAQVLAAFASDRLPLLKFLSLGTDMDEFSEPDIDIEDAEVVDICKHHPHLEVLTLPLGKSTTLASCAEALSLCPNLMGITTIGCSFELKRDVLRHQYNEEPFYADGRRYCKVDIKNYTAPIRESDVRTISTLRPFPLCHIRCIEVSESSVFVLSGGGRA